MACTKSGKIVGWQLMPAAYDESQAIPCVMHGADDQGQKGQAASKTQSSGNLNGFSKKAEVQVPSSTPKPQAEARSSSIPLDTGKSGRISKGLPPATSVSSGLTKAHADKHECKPLILHCQMGCRLCKGV